MRVLVALLATGLMVVGGNDGVGQGRLHSGMRGLHVVQAGEWAGGYATGAKARQGEAGAHNQRSVAADAGYRIRIHGLGTDGVAPPPPTPTPAPTPTPTPTVQVSRTVAEIICSYSWPCDQALAVARCESGLNPNAWNRTQVWIGGQAHHATGLFQMLIPLHSWRFNGADPFDPEANVRAAHRLFLERGWQPWHASAHCSGVW